MNPESTPRPALHLPVKALALLFLIFLLGAVAGVGGTIIYLTHRLQTNFSENLLHPDRGTGGAGNRLIDRFENELNRELSLTEDERQAVHAELDQTRSELRELRSGVGRDLRRAIVGTFLRVGRALPPEKRPAAREMARERMRRWGVQEE